MQKNTAGKWVVFAFDITDNTAVTGDAANITANIRIDGAAANAVDDTNPTELEDGYYIFDITAAEANGDNLVLCPASATADVQVIGVPGAVWTRPPNFEALGIEADGDLTKVNTLDGHTAQTGDTYALANGVEGFSAINTDVEAILVDTDTTLPALINTVDGKVDIIDGIVDDILVDTAEIGAAGVGLTEAGGDGDHLTAIDLPNQTMDITGNITGNLSGSVGSVTGAVGSVTAEVSADVTKISGTATAADYLEASAGTIVVDTVNDAGASTTAFIGGGTATLSAVNDHYNGRIIIFTSGTLANQATDITDYDGGTKTFTVTALTSAPANGVGFVIV